MNRKNHKNGNDAGKVRGEVTWPDDFVIPSREVLALCERLELQARTYPGIDRTSAVVVLRGLATALESDAKGDARPLRDLVRAVDPEAISIVEGRDTLRMLKLQRKLVENAQAMIAARKSRREVVEGVVREVREKTNARRRDEHDGNEVDGDEIVAIVISKLPKTAKNAEPIDAEKIVRAVLREYALPDRLSDVNHSKAAKNRKRD